jgi:N,N'-diacetyllegionaminate synthase
MKIGDRIIGKDEPIYVICEGGVTNYGRIDLGKKQVDVAIKAKADCIKFQVWKSEELISKRVADQLEAKLKFNWFQRMKDKEFDFEEISELYAYAKEKEITIFSTPQDNISLDFLASDLEQEVFKVGSGNAHNYEFLKAVGRHKKPVIISFGFQSDREIVKAIETLDKSGASEIIALHCVSLYPTPYENSQLQRIEHLKDLLGIPIGISDHSAGWHIPLAAIPLGVCVIEKHLTFDKTDPQSLDNPGALLPEEFSTFVQQVRDIEKALNPLSQEKHQQTIRKARDWLGQSAVAAQDIPLGEVIGAEMVAFKRPGLGGLPPERLPDIIGKKTIKHLEKDEQILLKYLV